LGAAAGARWKFSGTFVPCKGTSYRDGLIAAEGEDQPVAHLVCTRPNALRALAGKVQLLLPPVD